MKCPHCMSKISVFSKAMNSLDRQKKCPHCAKDAEIFINYKIAAILFLPTVALSIFIINPLVTDLGFSGALISGGVYGLIISCSMQLRCVDQYGNN